VIRNARLTEGNGKSFIAGLLYSDFELCRFLVNSNNTAKCNPPSEIDRNAPRTASTIQYGHASSKLGSEKRCVSGRRPTSHEGDHGIGVTGRVCFLHED